MIKRMSLSNRIFSNFGNFHIHERNSTRHSVATIAPVVEQDRTFQNSELHVSYMNIYPNTILLVLKGPLDGDTYETLINIGEALLSLKANCLIVDMSEVSKLTTSGLLAISNLVRIMNGQSSLDIGHGWAALHQMESDFQAGAQFHVKLLSPQPQILNFLTQSGITQICKIFDDIEAALKPLGWIAKD